MKTIKNSISIIFLIAGISLTGCYVEDPGFIQNGTQSFAVSDFNRLALGSGFDIKVQQGNYFEVVARGDQRNLRDLRANVESGILKIDYVNNTNRKHQTYITIVVPSLRGINFSGGSYSSVSGFDETKLDVHLSGASFCQLDANASDLVLTLSGASSLQLIGTGVSIDANLSGASVLQAFDFPHAASKVIATGASSAKIKVSTNLIANASGASVIIYRGNPSVDAYTSGGGSVHQE